MEKNKEIIPQSLAIKALKDSGYKDPAHALAELVDNAIEAKARHVAILCIEKRTQVETRERTSIFEIGILDDGIGMDIDTLEKALQFGNGSRLNSRSGIGRFGMGLPNASISLADKVEVWSWQNSKPLYTQFDVDNVEQGTQSVIPTPTPYDIPEQWSQALKKVSWSAQSKTGTLVKWSKLQRCQWRTSKTIAEKSSTLLGRVHRKFLDRNDIKFEFYFFTLENTEYVFKEKKAILPNDPMYLMANTSCPPPFNKGSMFEVFGNEKQYTIQKHPVQVRLSIAKLEAREGRNQGHTPHGEHAKKNIGISILRAERELELTQSGIKNLDPLHRWWGIEINFPPALDEIFGVTNNKQAATNLVSLLNEDIKDLVKDNQVEGITQLKEKWAEEGDARCHLIDIADYLQQVMPQLFREIEKQKKGSESENRHQLPESTKNSMIIAARHEEEKTPESEKIVQTKEALKTTIKEGMPELGEEEVSYLVQELLQFSKKYLIHAKEVDNKSFFSIEYNATIRQVFLNTRHKLYPLLKKLNESEDGELDSTKLREVIQEANLALKLLLFAWAELECTSLETFKTKFETVRFNLGAKLEELITSANLNP